MTMNNAYDKYKEQTVMTMTHGEMLTKLFDASITQMKAAVGHIGAGEIAATNTALQKAQNIFSYLQATLDKKYPISQSLSSLYSFFIRQCIDANIHKDTKPLSEIIPLVEELRDTFVQGDKLARMEKQPATPSVMMG